MNETCPRPELPPAQEAGAAWSLDLEVLKAQIRAAAARRREAPDAPPLPALRGIDWEVLAASLSRVEKHADITAGGPPHLPRLPGPLRLVGRWFARAVLFCARFLTNRQREYNHAALNALANLHRAVCRLEQTQRDDLQRLHEELRRDLGRRQDDPARRAA